MAARAASRLQGPDRSDRDCTRCQLRKQTCDRVRPRCSRCIAHDPSGRDSCFVNQNQTNPVVQPHVPLIKSFGTEWKMTDRGHQQLGKLLFAVSHPPKDMETFVETLISDQGRTIDELLQDNIFKWFPIVEACYMDSYVYVSSHDSEDNDSNKYLPLLHMAMLLVTSPAALVSDGGPVFDQMTFHTDLHKAINALLAVVSLNAKAHVHLIQTLGIVALYEFGIGAFEQAHRTLTSAFVMTSLCREYGVDMEAAYLETVFDDPRRNDCHVNA
ncbi:hypothetical protein NXS19_014222 [Fusarium pseudograminearum]|nr:hypothetical protein NXS19_014222 [Fusarium pseudograminearum]